MKKKINTIVMVVMALVFIAIESNAQDQNSEQFFLGKWKIMSYGLPQGDAELLVTFEKKDGKLGGKISTGEENAEAMAFTKVELEENSITAYYTTQGYDVYFILEKEDGNKVKGTMMDMFDMEGEKVKE
ncbi:hypothetical protein [Draconibacterium halophilum]|uniref:Uncharacterized protein n=1 Tax=Draconibacterium halophilum TaxID=2706887 RepID=A0A6C0RGF8_9BACT|nr:hypothetical protein [Draconibacterium halophilum]QIA09147.1 hypothetical protein G0Q07_16115 [Draconibacterium halophilum]